MSAHNHTQMQMHTRTHTHLYDLVPKGVHENRTKGVENKVDDTLKLVVFLECAQCYIARKYCLKAKDKNLCTFGDIC